MSVEVRVMHARDGPRSLAHGEERLPRQRKKSCGQVRHSGRLDVGTEQSRVGMNLSCFIRHNERFFPYRTCPISQHKSPDYHRHRPCMCRLVRSRAVQLSKPVLRSINDIDRKIHPKLDLSNSVKHIMRANCTYTLCLSNIEHNFPSERQHWNKEYPAVQRIFEGPTSTRWKPLSLCST